MAEAVQVGVRYCGGCNPRFDRVAAVEALSRSHPEAEFHHAETGVDYPVLLVVGGCTACCADLTGLQGRSRVFLRAAEDVAQADATIQAAIAADRATL